MNMASDDEFPLLPGLPNHIAYLCLSKVNPSLLYGVCRSWRRLIYSPSFPPFLSLYALLSPTQDKQNLSNSIEFFSLDPISSKWLPLPSPPFNILHHHPCYISRKLPVQTLAVSGRLVAIAATTQHLLLALPAPLVFDPNSNQWLSGPPFPSPRRWCAAGYAHGSIYVASGMGSRYKSDVVKSFERLDISKDEKEWCWEKLEGLKDGRFSREAIEAIGYRGKLCMVNVKGKEGAVYDIVDDKWEKMPPGMLAGWKGTAVGDCDVDGDDEIYVVDKVKGHLKKYDGDNDFWEEMIGGLEYLKGAEQIAVGGGRVCVVCRNGWGILVIDVVCRPVRFCIVKPPPNMEVVAVHILPRMSRPDCW